MGFQAIKTLKLDDLGDNWGGAELNFRALSFAELRELSGATTDENTTEQNFDFISNLVKSHLIDGKAWNGETLETVTEDNIFDLPSDVIVNRVVKLLVGTPDPKS